ncbi:MAG: Ig-like domain-containing protein, partial [Verrucomicrobia bacterium]|nr:Ig-like domain-containing protein [Verrucomicrobiota bacterium]
PDKSQTSEPQNLLAGTRYYFHAFMKEGGGGDNVQLAWREESDTTPANKLGNLSGSVLGTYVDPTGRGVNILTQPESASVVEGRTATVSALAVPVPANGGLVYQWQYKPPGSAGFVNIDGATGASYTSGPLPLGLNGALVRVIASTIGGISTTSTEVVLTVTKDSSAPVGRIHTVSGNGGVQIRVDFDEDVNAASALAPASYSLSKGSISSVSLVGARGVILQTTGLSVGDSFVLTLTGVKDLFGNSVTGSINGKVSTLSWVEIGGREWKNTAPDVVQIGANDFDLYSGGNGFWSNYDEGTFLYEEVTGDFNRQVRVEYQDASSHWARCGLMVRVATDEGTTRAQAQEIVDGAPGPKAMSQYQQLFLDPTTKWDGSGANNGHETNRRTEPGAQTGSSQNNFGGTAPPYPNAWIRMERKGDVLSYYKGINGVDWDFVGSIKISGPDSSFTPEMPAKVLVGMIYCPEIGNNGAAGQKTYMAKFRSYSDGASAPPADPAKLTVSSADGKVSVSWTPTGGTLQSSSAVGAGAVWTDVGAGNPASITPSSATLFLRVKN